MHDSGRSSTGRSIDTDRGTGTGVVIARQIRFRLHVASANVRMLDCTPLTIPMTTSQPFNTKSTIDECADLATSNVSPVPVPVPVPVRACSPVVPRSLVPATTTTPSSSSTHFDSTVADLQSVSTLSHPVANSVVSVLFHSDSSVLDTDPAFGAEGDTDVPLSVPQCVLLPVPQSVPQSLPLPVRQSVPLPAPQSAPPPVHLCVPQSVPLSAYYNELCLQMESVIISTTFMIPSTSATTSISQKKNKVANKKVTHENSKINFSVGDVNVTECLVTYDGKISEKMSKNSGGEEHNDNDNDDDDDDEFYGEDDHSSDDGDNDDSYDSRNNNTNTNENKFGKTNKNEREIKNENGDEDLAAEIKGTKGKHSYTPPHLSTSISQPNKYLSPVTAKCIFHEKDRILIKSEPFLSFQNISEKSDDTDNNTQGSKTLISAPHIDIVFVFLSGMSSTEYQSHNHAMSNTNRNSILKQKNDDEYDCNDFDGDTYTKFTNSISSCSPSVLIQINLEPLILSVQIGNVLKWKSIFDDIMSTIPPAKSHTKMSLTLNVPVCDLYVHCDPVFSLLSDSDKKIDFSKAMTGNQEQRNKIDKKDEDDSSDNYQKKERNNMHKNTQEGSSSSSIEQLIEALNLKTWGKRLFSFLLLFLVKSLYIFLCSDFLSF